MQLSYENIRIKKYVNVLVSSLTALAGVFATYSREHIEPAYKDFLKKIGPKSLSSQEGLLEIVYFFSLAIVLYVLSNKLLIKIAEIALERKSKLNGWWIYGFKVNDKEIIKDLSKHGSNTDFDNSGDSEFYVVGKFQIVHKVTGMSIKDRGQSDYLIQTGQTDNPIRLEMRGTWKPYEIICNENYSEMWIIYHFEKIKTEESSYYDGFMKLSNTGRSSIMAGNNWYAKSKETLRSVISKSHWIYRWFFRLPLWILNKISRENHLYKGTIQDLSKDGLKFSTMFAEKVPNKTEYVDGIDEIIKKNAQKIIQIIDNLKH
jgi:hypothetical protein